MTSLFDSPIPPSAGTDESLEDRWRAFHEDNPHVLAELRRLALQLKARGHRRYSIAGLFEVLRFRAAMRTTGDEYKLNNSFRAFYARELMRTTPSLTGFFETREQRAAS